MNWLRRHIDSLIAYGNQPATKTDFLLWWVIGITAAFALMLVIFA